MEWENLHGTALSGPSQKKKKKGNMTTIEIREMYRKERKIQKLADGLQGSAARQHEEAPSGAAALVPNAAYAPALAPPLPAVGWDEVDSPPGQGSELFFHVVDEHHGAHASGLPPILPTHESISARAQNSHRMREGVQDLGHDVERTRRQECVATCRV
jgi:hypothetical protein